MSITREDWRRHVMLPQLRQAWNLPDELAAQIARGLQDGYAAELEEAARHLRATDPLPARGATLLAVVHLETGRPQEAEALLREHLERHGEEPLVLVNLAKALTALERGGEADAVLWRALELDPNQPQAVEWYGIEHREREGDEAGEAALRRIAALPGSWRAQLMMARIALQQKDLEQALSLYGQSLAVAGKPVPTDLLVEMTGYLGNYGHLPELLDLAGPRFDLELHGLQVGNNLIKACIDCGQLDQAHELLRRHQAKQRPDWKETLSFWENELAKAYASTASPRPPGQWKATLLPFPGPLWLRSESPLAAAFPVPAAGAPRITVSGSTVEGRPMADTGVPEPSDAAGRLSRAIPLWLGEHLFLRCGARSLTQIPWVLTGGGFILSGTANSDADAVTQGRLVKEGEEPDYVASCHLMLRGENWRLRVRLVRCIDGSCVAEILQDFAEGAFHVAAGEVLRQLDEAIGRETELRSRASDPDPGGVALDAYLFRLEQCLALCCSCVEGVGEAFLNNPAEILDGIIDLCLELPTHGPSRMLLWRGLRALRQSEPELVRSLKPKVEALMSEHPLPGVLQGLLEDEIGALLGD